MIEGQSVMAGNSGVAKLGHRKAVGSTHYVIGLDVKSSRAAPAACEQPVSVPAGQAGLAGPAARCVAAVWFQGGPAAWNDGAMVTACIRMAVGMVSGAVTGLPLGTEAMIVTLLAGAFGGYLLGRSGKRK